MPDKGASTVGAYEAKTHFSELLERVEGGQEVTITRHGTPVAKLIPVQKKMTVSQRREAIQRWNETARHLSLRGLQIRDMIDEGRR